MPRSTVWAGVIALSLGPPGARGQDAGISLEPVFTIGQSARYSLDAAFSRRRGEAGQGPGTALHQTAGLRVSTVSVSADRSAVVRLVFERLRVEITGPDGVPASWDWAEGADAGTVTGPEVRGMSESYLALAKSTLDVRVASDGWVRDVGGLERAFEAAFGRRGRAASAATLLGVFDPGAVEQTLSSLWALGPGGGEALRPKIGDSWEIVRRAPFLGGSRTEARTTCVLERAAADRAEIVGDVRYTLIAPHRDTDPALPVPRLSDQSGRVSITWDRAAGRLVQRMEERTLDWSATLGLERPIEVRDHTAARIEFKLLD